LLKLNNLRLSPSSAPAQLEFAPGEIGVVLGRNNCGKTNLLRLIAGLSTRAQGEVVLDGKPLQKLGRGRRPVAYVFQEFVNYPHWSVEQNIESPLRSGKRRISRTERSRRVAQIAETLQLQELLDRRPAELSGGQQQRLAIGRALATDARILLLDEPFVNLDFRLRERLTEQLGDLLKNSDTQVLFASSDCRDAFALGDSVSLLADQNVLQSGAPVEIYRKPVWVEAAHLMSEPSVNLLPSAADSATVHVVRPEHMKLSAAELGDEAADALRYQLQVEAVETSGSHTFVQGLLVGSPESEPRWVARLSGMPDLDIKKLVGDGSSDQRVEFFVDPRNRLEVAHSRLGAAVLAGAEVLDGAA